ncbi:MAG TPA: hypothetical protein VFJ16_27425 [Longimicrobium sp.]|nr:hypothetical protein [Longimicrobium sp.]
MMEAPTVEPLEAGLAEVARQIARLLTSAPVDQRKVDELDARAALLRREIQRLRPAGVGEELVFAGTRLLSGG